MKRILSIILLIIIIISIMTIEGYAKEVTPSFEVVGNNVQTGDVFNVDIKINNNPGITSLQINVEYSNSDLELLSVEDKGLFSNAISHSDLKKNPLIVSWYSNSSTNSNNSGVLATLQFRVKEDAKSSKISLSYDVENVFDIDFNNIVFELINGEVNVLPKDMPSFSISSEAGSVNDIVDVKVSIENNKDITALRIKIEYSIDDLELLEISDGGLFEESISHSVKLSSPITISWYSEKSQNVSNNGTLAILKFRIKDNAHSSKISLRYDEDDVFDNNFDNVLFNVNDGTVSVIEKTYIRGDANSNGLVEIGDSTLIQMYLAKKVDASKINLVAASIMSSEVTIADATRIQQYLAKQIEKL